MSTKFLMMTKAVAASLLFLFGTEIYAAENPYQLILNMMSRKKNIRQAAAAELLQLKDPSYSPAMVDVLFYMPRSARKEMIAVLEEMTGHKGDSEYYDWVEYIGKRSDLKSPPGYVKFKATLFSLLDPDYKKIFYTGVPLRIRPEEIVWGGVAIDGIPPVDTPKFIPAADAKLKPNEKVFGIALKGEMRAYPLRYLSWHEMLNDRIGGEPVTISY